MRWFCLVVKLQRQKSVAIGAAMSSQILVDSLIYTVMEEGRGGGGEDKKKTREKGDDFLATGVLNIIDIYPTKGALPQNIVLSKVVT